MFGLRLNLVKRKMSINRQSEYNTLKSVLLKHPKDAFRDQKYIDENWKDLNYLAKPDFNKACLEYDQFVQIFTDNNVEVQFLPAHSQTGMDSLYVRDASIIFNEGAFICNMGKSQRSGEPAHQMEFFTDGVLPITSHCQIPGKIEGGDVAWLNENVMAIAHGYRANADGIRQIQAVLSGVNAELIVMESPHYKGPSDVFHLMSVLSPVDKDLAVVYSPLMTVPFRNRLLDMGIEFVEVPDEEFESLGCNVFAIGPRKCLMVKGNPKTKALLERAGAEVIEFEGDEICLKGSGGPTCLTRPIDRLI
jgi:N-dimethylarginine dimethylaminohydrolase